MANTCYDSYESDGNGLDTTPLPLAIVRLKQVSYTGDYMHRFVKHTIAVLVLAAFITAPFHALASTDEDLQDPQLNAAYMVGDALIARPLGIVATVAGFALFIVSSPFSLISSSAGDAWDGMVVYPAKFTFSRGLGDFE